MPAIDGIASGIDTTAIVNALSDAARAQATPIRNRIEEYERRREGISQLSSRLQSVADTMRELRDPNTLVPLVSTLWDESQFSVDTEQANVSGQFSVQVKAMAQRSSSVTGGFASRDGQGLLTYGTFTVEVGGESTDITIDASNDSLDGFAASLNDLDGVQAYVVDTGEPTDPFKLVITAEDSGLAGGLTLTNNTGQAALDPDERVAAQDALVTINGLDVYSASNTLKDAIPGVTLNLGATGDVPVVLGLERDEAGMKERLNGFVESFNAVTTYLRIQKAFDADAGIRGRLVGEPTADRVVRELGSMLSGQYATDSAFEALSQIGIKTENNGDISLDEELFESSFAERYDDVVAILTSDDGPFARMADRIEDVYVDEDSGTLQSRDETLEGLITDSNDAIDRIEERVSQTELRLRQRFTAMELAISASNSTGQYLAALLPNTGLLGTT